MDKLLGFDLKAIAERNVTGNHQMKQNSGTCKTTFILWNIKKQYKLIPLSTNNINWLIPSSIPETTTILLSVSILKVDKFRDHKQKFESIKCQPYTKHTNINNNQKLLEIYNNCNKSNCKCNDNNDCGINIITDKSKNNINWNANINIDFDNIIPTNSTNENLMNPSYTSINMLNNINNLSRNNVNINTTEAYRFQVVCYQQIMHIMERNSWTRRQRCR